MAASNTPNMYNLGKFRVNMDDVRDNIFDSLSLTSQFKVSLFLTSSSISNLKKGDQDLISHLRACKLVDNDDLLRYDFLCSEAVLPGSTFDMAEEYGSRQGIIERFPTRRVYSDFNLTFYVDADYKLIRLFEEWMNFIDPLYSSDKLQYSGSRYGQANSAYADSNSFFRFKYPNLYKKSIGITKFERNYSDAKGNKQDPTSLTYQFIDAFPTNLTALPLSYEGSTITKTTVNFSYSRYIVMKHNGRALSNESRLNTKTSTVLSTPEEPSLIARSRSVSGSQTDNNQDSNPISGGEGQNVSDLAAYYANTDGSILSQFADRSPTGQPSVVQAEFPNGYP